jgi:tRNA pseudouridine65 synthase
MHSEELDILYKDEHLVAVNKPSKLLVHKSPIDKRETRFALQIVRDQIGAFVYPLHRLDKPTSGVLIFALSSKMAKLMGELFRQNEIKKEYIAVVRGYVNEEEIIDYPLKFILDKKADRDAKENKEPQDAQTIYRRLSTLELPYPVSRYSVARYSLVRLFPQTGRKHQLRRHLKHIFHPIVGDTKYGRGEHNRLFREKFNLDRLLLHSNKISFIHPITKINIEINAPIDSEFRKITNLFGDNIL